MGKLIPFHNPNTSSESLVVSGGKRLSDRNDELRETPSVLVLAKLLELIPSLDELANKLQTLNKRFPAASLGAGLDHQRIRVLTQIDRAKCQAIDLVFSELAMCHQTKSGETDEW